MTDTKQLRDEDLVKQVQHGAVDVFDVLVRRYEEKMMRYARRFLYSTADQEDVVQNVFIKAFVNIKSFDTSRRFSPWLYRIAHNEFISTIRKQKLEPLPFFDPDTLFPHPIAKERPDDDIFNTEQRDEIERVLEQLEAKYREPIILHYFEEFSYKEIADILRIPTSTVGVRLKRGREKLKALLEQQ